MVLIIIAILITLSLCCLAFVHYFSNEHYNIAHKHILITGGSEAIARECIRKGASFITILSRDKKKLRTALHTLKSLKDNNSVTIIHAISCDVTNVNAIKEVFSWFNEGSLTTHNYTEILETNDAVSNDKSTLTHPGPVDVLINCAGLCICDDIDKLSADDLERQLRVNILGSLYPCQEIVKYSRNELIQFKKAKSRMIVLIGSIASQLNIYGFVGYGASKFAIRGIWEALSMECMTLNIHVMCGFPPNTDTPGFLLENQRKPKITSIIEDIPGLYTPEHVAQQFLKAIVYKKRRVTFGITGYLLAALTAGFSPSTNLCEYIMDLLLLPLAKIVAGILTYQWKQIIQTQGKIQLETLNENFIESQNTKKDI